ncbi:MAG: type IX secretion system membrane protein PorP/SprF [Cytophagales bacterium]
MGKKIFILISAIYFCFCANAQNYKGHYSDSFIQFNSNTGNSQPCYFQDSTTWDIGIQRKMAAGELRDIALTQVAVGYKLAQKKSVQGFKFNILNEQEGPYIGYNELNLNYCIEKQLFKNWNAGVGIAGGFHSINMNSPTYTMATFLPNLNIGAVIKNRSTKIYFSSLQFLDISKNNFYANRYFVGSVCTRKTMNYSWNWKPSCQIKIYKDVPYLASVISEFEYKESLNMAVGTTNQFAIVSAIEFKINLHTDKYLRFGVAYQHNKYSSFYLKPNSIEFKINYSI